MKLCFFDDNRFGVVKGDAMKDVTAVLDRLPTIRDAAAAAGPGHPVSSTRFLSPVANPGKVVTAPVNYRAHHEAAIADPAAFSLARVNRIQESGLFLKATSSIAGTSAGVALRFPNRRNDHEIEPVAVIGTGGPDIAEEDALRHVAGYTLGRGMTLRAPEERSFRKSIDSYTAPGPWLVTADEFGDPADVEISPCIPAMC